ncbi:nucleotidyltransferase domain-containing protein [Candidatus Saccharibacteria bacterium]|nr:nucleotidyltransferase domain-containing protein [Candidatus Saccharibacteria bacterium]
MLTITDIQQAVAKVGKKYGIKNAYLFGSYAKGTANEDSDVDLIIDRGNIRGLIEFNGFRLDLSEELGTDVDILTKNSAGEKFYNLIKNDRILVYGG